MDGMKFAERRLLSDTAETGISDTAKGGIDISFMFSLAGVIWVGEEKKLEVVYSSKRRFGLDRFSPLVFIVQLSDASCGLKSLRV